MVALGNKTEPTAYFSLRPDQGNANGGNGKMWSSRAKVSKTPHLHGASLQKSPPLSFALESELKSLKTLSHSCLDSGGVEGADYQREVEEEDAAAVEENLQGERHGSAPKPTFI